MLTFFHSPGSCSDGILMLLAEVEAPFETQVIQITKGEGQAPDYLALNPKGKVPALRTETGRVLTEFPAIAYWLANKYPDAGLWPADLDQQQHVLEVLDFIVSSVHMRAFTFVRVPQKFRLTEAGTEDLRTYGKAEFTDGLAKMSVVLRDQDYMTGNFGIADAAAFYVLRWARMTGFDLPANLAALSDRLAARPAVARVFPDG